MGYVSYSFRRTVIGKVFECARKLYPSDPWTERRRLGMSALGRSRSDEKRSYKFDSRPSLWASPILLSKILLWLNSNKGT